MAEATVVLILLILMFTIALCYTYEVYHKHIRSGCNRNSARTREQQHGVAGTKVIPDQPQSGYG